MPRDLGAAGVIFIFIFKSSYLFKSLVEQWRADDYEQRYTRLIREIGYRVRGMVADRSVNQAKRMTTQKGEIEGEKKIKRRLKVKEKEEKDVCRKLIVCFRQIRSSIERQQRKQEEERKEKNLSDIDTVHNNNNNSDDDDDDDDKEEDGNRKEKSGTEQKEEGEERTTNSGQDIVAGVLSETVARVAFQVEEERLHLGACLSNIYIFIYIYILYFRGRWKRGDKRKKYFSLSF